MFKDLFKKEADHVKSNVLEFEPGTLIPPEVIAKRVADQASAKSFEELRLKVIAADEAAKEKAKQEALAIKLVGTLQDHGEDQELGEVAFDISYDVGAELLKVTLKEAANLRPFSQLEYISNARVTVGLRNVNTVNSLADIPPRPKFKGTPEVTDGLSFGLTQPPKGQKPCKSPLIESYSSSVFWRTSHPVWNEDFVFEDIKNRSLKKLDLVFTVYDRHPVPPPLPPREDLLGEARIPLIKIHKTLARKKVRATLPNDTDSEKPAPKLEPVMEVVEKRHVSPPRIKVGNSVDHVYKWLNGTDVSLSDDEMEELASICNSEPVHELLKDPELMDSVSIREFKAAMAESNANVDAIKKLTNPTKPVQRKGASSKQTTEIKEEDSEVDLPASKRPQIYRNLKGWRYLNRIKGQRPVFGELKIGLNYDTNHSRLTVTIAKGKNMRDPTERSRLMKLWVSVQKKTKIFKKVTPFAKRFNEAIEVKEKAGKVKKTSIREDTDTPVWNVPFDFNITVAQIPSICIDILVYSGKEGSERDKVIGGVRLGRQSTKKAMNHWNEMIDRPGFPVFLYYTLL